MIHYLGLCGSLAGSSPLAPPQGEGSQCLLPDLLRGADLPRAPPPTLTAYQEPGQLTKQAKATPAAWPLSVHGDSETPCTGAT